MSDKQPRTRESWLWFFSREREEKEHKRIEEMIRKKDEKALGKWLKDFGHGGWKEILEKDKF